MRRGLLLAPGPAAPGRHLAPGRCLRCVYHHSKTGAAAARPAASNTALV